MWKTAFKKFWRDMICLSIPFHFILFKGCLPQILLGPFFNTLPYILRWKNTIREAEHMKSGKSYLNANILLTTLSGNVQMLHIIVINFYLIDHFHSRRNVQILQKMCKYIGKSYLNANILLTTLSENVQMLHIIVINFYITDHFHSRRGVQILRVYWNGASNVKVIIHFGLEEEEKGKSLSNWEK